VAQRLFLHVGTMKSGTSYLRSLWWQNHDALAARGLLLPGDGKGTHYHAASEVVEREDVLALMTAEQRGTWDRVVAEAAAAPGDVLISHDLFSRADPGQADRALRRLEGVSEEVHAVVTARDLGRQLPSAWQQEVKEGSAVTFEEYWQAAEREPDGQFWTHHDVPALLGRWSQGLPGERSHLVVLPGPGAPRAWLWERMCELTGVDPGGLDAEAERSNDSLGIGEVEVLRRIHATLPPERRTLETVRFLKGHFTRQVLVSSGPGERFTLSPEMHAWTVARAEAMVADLRARAWHVVGDLDDLLPAPRPEGRTPAEVTGDEVAEVAVRALTQQLLRSMDQRDELRVLRAEARSSRRARRGPAAD
jgi:hypothetical protein